MEIVHDIANLKTAERPSVTAIGVFDGVHLGHQAIIKRTVDEAHSRNARSVVVTFEPHPGSVLERAKQPPILTAIELKAELIEQLGVDLLVIVKFTKAVAGQSPQEFVDSLLLKLLATVLVVVGTDFRFGKKAAGNIDFLEEYGRKRGFEVVSLPLVPAGDLPISSTRVRKLLSLGDLDGARSILGRYPRITGVVVSGYGRGGAILGFPTANIDTPDVGSVPGRGVYAGRVRLDPDKWRTCVIDIGTSPTFAQASEKTEIHVHIPGLDLDLYGKHVEVEIQMRIRDEKRFSDEEALKRQIAKDIEVAMKSLAAKKTEVGS